jgi:predicted ArsR family transcriptional regulator
MTTKREPDPRAVRQRERILTALKAGPLTAAELCARLHLSRSRVTTYLRLLRAAGKVRITGHDLTDGAPACRYGIGSGPDAVFEPIGKTRKGSLYDQRQAQIVALLAEPQSVQQLVAVVKIAPTGVRVYLRHLRDAGRVHIAFWRRSRSALVPVYALGNAPDAPSPGRQTNAAYRAKATQRQQVKSRAWATALFTQGAQA